MPMPRQPHSPRPLSSEAASVDAEAGAATLEADAVRVTAMKAPTGGYCREAVDTI